MDRDSAERAAHLWGSLRNHFRPEFLAELSLEEAGKKRDRLDSNWITYAHLDAKGLFIECDWISRYWNGDQYPNNAPVWETLVEGRIIVLGTELRNRAYTLVKRRFPDSLMFLEIARQAAGLGSDLGSICAWIHDAGNDFSLDYLMDMCDAENAGFLEKLTRLRDSGHPINFADMKSHIDKDSFGNVPDFRPFSFRRSKSAITNC